MSQVFMSWGLVTNAAVPENRKVRAVPQADLGVAVRPVTHKSSLYHFMVLFL